MEQIVQRIELMQQRQPDVRRFEMTHMHSAHQWR